MSSPAKPQMSELAQTTSASTDASGGSVTINDYEFCANHGREICNDCGVDALEGNDFVAGIDHIEGREPIEVTFTHNKAGDVVCKKHNQANDACFAFKKQIQKLSREAAKSNKKNKKPTSVLQA